MKVLVKLSGKILESVELRTSLSVQVRELGARGAKVILVHGAGKQLSDHCRACGIPVTQHSGRRVTDLSALEAAVKVFSAVNREITSAMLARGVRAVGISAFDGNLTQSRRRPPITLPGDKEKTDFGFVAEIERVNPQLVETLWESGFIPVTASLCADAEGQILNINADTLAAELALALSVDCLVSVSDVDGLYLDLGDPSSLISRLSLDEARRLLSSGTFSEGMIPKIENAVRVLERGVPRYHLVSGLSRDGIVKTLEGRAGTLLSA